MIKEQPPGCFLFYRRQGVNSIARALANRRCALFVSKLKIGLKCGGSDGLSGIKIATNTALAKKEPGWIDLDAQTATTDDLFNLILRTANGQQTQNERHGYREIAIFKDGVTM